MNHLDEPVLIAASKTLLTELGIHHRLESCAYEMDITVAPMSYVHPAINLIPVPLHVGRRKLLWQGSSG